MHSHVFEKTPGSLRDHPEVGVVKCSICGLISHEKDMRAMVSYSSGTMHDWTKNWGERNPPLEDVNRRISAIQDLLEEDKLGPYLDFGCGAGDLVRNLRSVGKQAFGYDPEIMNEARDLHGLGLVVDELSSLSELKFSLISLFHVIEHVYEPLELFQLLKGMLKPGGKVLIETPNANDALITDYSCDEFLRFTFWSHHPMLHTNQSLEEIISEAGLVISSSGQVQRYDLANHLYWLSLGDRGGNVHWAGRFGESTSRHYAGDLVQRGVADTIWIVATA